jgi:hypothetical protein
MRAIKKVRLLIEQDPKDPTSQIFSRLIFALVEESDFSMKDLYVLGNADFQLAMEILQEWRLDRYYMGKTKTFDTAQQALALVKTQK